jgi:hypothetical protein
MRIALQIVSLVALGVVVLPSIVYFSGNMELDRVKWLLLLATIVWFVVTPFWMGKDAKS